FEELSATSSTGYGQLIIEEGGNDQIAVLSLDGVIQDTGNGSPFFFDGYNHQFFLNQLYEINEDHSIKGVILKVNSPGGGVVESAEIYDAIRTIQENREIPV
ncbi:ATP-dependent Clp protease proteolytic subunit, partial [Microvirga sp. 3-52]|nr:ATP-dependent Clp protease proteolytic subunit [Microvirga sp. 3-52]